MSGQDGQDEAQPTAAAGGRLVAQYLKELSHTARVLPPARRDELVQDVRSHIAVALSERGDQDPDTVRAVLDGLGQPAEIVAAALADSGVDGPPISVGIGGREIAAIVLLLFGAVLVGLGWLAGVLLLWASPRWTVREKVVGTLVLPGGVVLPIVLAAGVASGPALVPALLAVVGAALPVLSAVWLVRRARTAAVVDVTPRWSMALLAVGAVVLALPVVSLPFLSATSTVHGPGMPVSVPSGMAGTPTQSAS